MNMVEVRFWIIGIWIREGPLLRVMIMPLLSLFGLVRVHCISGLKKGVANATNATLHCYVFMFLSIAYSGYNYG